MAEARLEACHAAGEDAAQAVDVEGAAPDRLNLVLQDGGHLITAQVGHRCGVQWSSSRQQAAARGIVSE
jgi:hypothetical protein